MLRFSLLFSALITALAVGCAPELDLPPPPDIDGRLESFQAPDAVVVPQVMAATAEEIDELRDHLEDASFYEELLRVIVDVQDELYNEEGELELGGVSFGSANGGVTVDYICDGWDGATEPDEANGSISLNMRLAAGSIAPLVWGAVESCKYPVVVLDRQVDALYNGEVAIVLEEPLSDDMSPFRVDVTFIVVGTAEVDGQSFELDDLFRVSFIRDGDETRLNRLDLLVELADETSFVYSFFADTTQQVRDSVGTFSCSLEARECNSPSGTFSW